VMASCRSGTDLKTPRRMRLRVIAEKKPSTALIQDADVGSVVQGSAVWTHVALPAFGVTR
jgi:hypothetical protein